MASDDALVSGAFDELHYLQYALHLPNYNGEQSRLQSCIDQVHRKTTVLVQSNHEPLRAQVESLEDAHNSVKTMGVSLISLQQCSQRLRYTIQEPFEMIQTKASQLKHLTHSVDIVRSLQRFIVLVGKLHEVVDHDIVRASRALHDVEEIVSECDLRGIEIYDTQMEYVTKASTSIRSRAHDLLKKSIASQNQADCGLALQCFFLLESLPRVVDSAIAENKREALRTIVKALELSSLQKQLEGDATTSKQQFFTILEEALASVIAQSNATALIWRILHRKRDPVSQQTFASALSYNVHPLEEMWLSISSNLKEKIQKIVRRNNFHLMVVSEFPRFGQVLKTFCETMTDFIRESKRTIHTPEWQLLNLDGPQLWGSWLSDVINEVKQHYNAFLVDRNREKLHPLMWKVNAGPEADGAEVKVDPRRISTTLPPQVTSIDPRPFLKFLTHEVVSARNSRDVLTMILQNVLVSITQLHQRMTEMVSKQVAPSPNLNKPLSTVEVYLVAMCNASLTVYNDLTQLSVMLPSYDHNDYTQLVKQIKEITSSFKNLGHNIAKPFYKTAGETLSVIAANIVAVFSSSAGIGSASAVQQQLGVLLKQFEAKFDYFLSRYALLFEKCQSLDVMKTDLCLRIWTSFTTALSLRRPITDEDRTLASQVLQDFLVKFEVFCPTEGVYKLQKECSTLQQLYKCATISDISALSSGKSLRALHPVMIVLHLMQRVDPGQGETWTELPKMMKLSEAEFRTCVWEALHQQQPETSSQTSTSVSGSGEKKLQSILTAIQSSIEGYRKATTVEGEASMKRKLILEVCAQQLNRVTL